MAVFSCDGIHGCYILAVKTGQLYYDTDVQEKVEKNRRYAREREYLRDCAARDSMTRLLNRGTMEDRIKEELESVAEGQNLCIHCY